MVSRNQIWKMLRREKECAFQCELRKGCVALIAQDESSLWLHVYCFSTATSELEHILGLAGKLKFTTSEIVLLGSTLQNDVRYFQAVLSDDLRGRADKAYRLLDEAGDPGRARLKRVRLQSVVRLRLRIRA